MSDGMKRRGTQQSPLMAYANRKASLDEAMKSNLGTPRRAVTPATPQPGPKLNVKAPARAEVNADRQSALQKQGRARYDAAVKAGNTRLAGELKSTFGI